MAYVLTLAHEISRVHGKYRKVHAAIYGLSLSGSLWRSALVNPERLASWENDLGAQRRKLGEIEAEINALGKSDSTKPMGKDLTATLIEYIATLSETINKLQWICRNMRLELAGDEDFRGYRETQFRLDTTDYDDSVQAYRRLGTKLNRLIKRF